MLVISDANVEFQVPIWYLKPMEKKRKKFNTTLKADLIKRLKILAAETEVNVNDLLEDAIETFLKKYDKDPKKQS